MRYLALMVCLLYSLPTAASDSAEFQQLLHEHWQRANQEQVFFRMDPDAWRFAGKLAEWTPAARERRHRYNEAVLQRLDAIDPAVERAGERQARPPTRDLVHDAPFPLERLDAIEFDPWLPE